MLEAIKLQFLDYNQDIIVIGFSTSCEYVAACWYYAKIQ